MPRTRTNDMSTRCALRPPFSSLMATQRPTRARAPSSIVVDTLSAISNSAIGTFSSPLSLRTASLMRSIDAPSL